MVRKIRSALIAMVIICAATPDASASGAVLKIATTTSTQSSGLLDILLPEFNRDAGIVTKVVVKGTGAAIRDGMDGNVDVILVHAKSLEEKFVRQGYGVKRFALMHNDFVVLGPPQDPAGIKGLPDVASVFRQIAGTKACFISRGDGSGTHIKEQEIWRATGLALRNQSLPVEKGGPGSEFPDIRPTGADKWYISIGQGQGNAIIFADEKHAYTMVDRGTFIRYKYGMQIRLDLEILFAGDPVLYNSYGLIPINPKRFPHVQYDLARKFVDWMVSEKGQSLIKNYRLFGHQLFSPDAIAY
ncbi:MAG: substrate-binding domain-containing protein [Desulfobacterales bacterium]|nr:substrate-binding domain-containing protein [Desulfobacterales bacterium]